MDVNLSLQCISYETIFKLNKKTENNFNTIYIINRQKTPVFCLFNDKYFDLKKEINNFFNHSIYTIPLYIKNYLDYNITWSQIELDIFSLEADVLKIKFKESNHSLILLSTYFLHLVENAYYLEANINNYLSYLNEQKVIREYFFSKIKQFYYNLYGETINNEKELNDEILLLYNNNLDELKQSHEITSKLYNSFKKYNLLLGKYYSYELYDKSYKVLMKKLNK